LPKKTFEIAIKTGNGFLTQVKENQKQLLEDCKDTHLFNTQVEVSQSEEKAHGRIEKRTTTLHKTNESITDVSWQLLIAVIIVVNRVTMKKNTKTKQWEATEETSYYVCSSDRYSLVQLQDAIRNHWAIENSNHYVKDNALKEDQSKIKKKADLMARIRSFALNILRGANVENISQTLYRTSLNFDRLYSYKHIFD